MRMVSGRRDWKTYMFPHPTIQRTVWTGPEKVFIDSCSRAQWCTTSEMEIRACEKNLDGYSATRPTLNFHQKYSRENWFSDQLMEQWSIWLTCMWLLRRGYRLLGEGLQESKCWEASLYVLKLCYTWEVAQVHQICLRMGLGGGVTTPRNSVSIKQ